MIEKLTMNSLRWYGHYDDIWPAFKGNVEVSRKKSEQVRNYLDLVDKIGTSPL